MDIEFSDDNSSVPVKYEFTNFDIEKYKGVPGVASELWVYGYPNKNSANATSFIRMISHDNGDGPFVYLSEDETEAMILALTHALMVYRGENK